MTNEQAVRWLKDLLKSDLPMEQYETAIKKGIEALKPSGDLISRKDTLTAFADYVGGGMSMNDYDALWDIVTKMPSVKQEPKTDTWSIRDVADTLAKHGLMVEQEPKAGHWKRNETIRVTYCSECGFGQYIDEYRTYNYCPNCGAKMESEE